MQSGRELKRPPQHQLSTSKMFTAASGIIPSGLLWGLPRDEVGRLPCRRRNSVLTECVLTVEGFEGKLVVYWQRH